MASTNTATPRGAIASLMASAIWAVIVSWFCRRLEKGLDHLWAILEITDDRAVRQIGDAMPCPKDRGHVVLAMALHIDMG